MLHITPQNNTIEFQLQIENALDEVMKIYKKALNQGLERYLEGPVIKPVFRKFN